MRPILKTLSAAVVLATATASQAALLTYDVRAVSAGSSSGVTINSAKSVTVSGTGQTVALQVFGVLANANASTSDDGISAGGGSVTSGAGGLLGNLGNTAVASALNNTSGGASPGAVADLDGDGDLDVGSSLTASSLNYFTFRTTNGSNPVAGAEVLLGTLTFTTTGSSGSTTVNFVPAALTTGTVASRNYHQFTIDGTSYVRTATGLTAGDVGSGTGVTVSVVPEPASLAVLGLAGLGVLARRRKA